MAEVRYMVDDVDASIDFYTRNFGFTLRERFGPAMAIINRGDLTLWLAGPMASARKPMPDGVVPQPGGWSRIVIRVDDLDASAAALRTEGARFRNEVVSGPGGRQILCLDPSGNIVELFEER
ncbi:MAG: VOC family protein [Paracoccaceae bacterium]